MGSRVSDEDRLIFARGELVRARHDLRDAQDAYFSADPPTAELAARYHAALSRAREAEADLARAREDAAIGGTWISRPDMYRAA